MSTIKVLEKSVADKIAAGEVIERPVSVVKELAENAIDAGATDITVEIKRGGREMIRVTDNGCGIPSSEVLTAFLRHATSKIRKAEDLKSLTTLGFRGEALASIAAVTRLEMITKTKDENAGVHLIIHGGNVISSEAAGCPNGTTVIVRDLFYNTPARAKFLKNDAAESSMVIELMSKIALTHPEIRFRMDSAGSNVFTTQGRGDLLAAIIAVYKERDYRNLVPIRREGEGMRVFGYISKPALSRASRRSQYFFVNERVVDSKVMEKGLMSGYKERLFQGRYPIAFIFLETDPANLDVNIHPNKKEVRFGNELAVIEIIRDAVIDALAAKEAVPDVTDTNKFKNKENITSPKAHKGKEQVDIKSFLSNKRAQLEADSEKEESHEIGSGAKESSANDSEVNESFAKNTGVRESHSKVSGVEESSAFSAFEGADMKSPAIKPFDFDDLKLGEIIFDTYITATDDENFYLIDQHAAHERINYENFVRAYNKEEKASQMLLLPITIDVPPALSAAETVWTDDLRKMGYDIDNFGENTYIVRAIPDFLTMEEAEAFLNDYVDQCAEGEKIGHKAALDKIVTHSCKSAIKAHDRISSEEAEALIARLKRCANPYSCPHGRPTFVRFSLHDIEHMFKRIV